MIAMVLSDTELLLMRTVEQADEHYGDDVGDLPEDGDDDTEIIEYPADYFKLPPAETETT
jgi:hypothetical protein